MNNVIDIHNLKNKREQYYYNSLNVENVIKRTLKELDNYKEFPELLSIIQYLNSQLNLSQKYYKLVKK